MGYSIEEELYQEIGHRSIACTLILKNGYEVTGVHCIEISELIHEDKWKKKAFENAYAKYMNLKNAVDRQTLYQTFYVKEGDYHSQESI